MPAAATAPISGRPSAHRSHPLDRRSFSPIVSGSTTPGDLNTAGYRRLDSPLLRPPGVRQLAHQRFRRPTRDVGARALVCAYTIQSKVIDRDADGVGISTKALVVPRSASITHADDDSMDADVSLKSIDPDRDFISDKVGQQQPSLGWNAPPLSKVGAGPIPLGNTFGSTQRRPALLRFRRAAPPAGIWGLCLASTNGLGCVAIDSE